MSKKPLNTATFELVQQEYGQNKQTFSLPELQAYLHTQSIEIPERTLRRWLSQWVQAKKLIKTGQKRGTRYQLAPNPPANTPLFLQNTEPEKQAAVLAKLRDLWTHSSTAIEGNTLTLGDTHSILELGLTISGKPLREHHEVVGHAKAIDLIYQISTEPLNKEHIFALHKAVQTEVVVDIYQPIGKWKKEKNFSNSITSNGEQMIIEYAEPSHVNELMTLLINEINQWNIADINQQNAHQHYAKIHLAFVHIHPFDDGNGRLARLIANLPLLKAELPPLLIDQNKRREYITLLADYQSAIGTPKADGVKSNGFWPKAELLEPVYRFCRECYQITRVIN